jgi:hypothetical protein
MVARIDQHPVAAFHPLDADVAAAGFLQIGNQAIGDRGHMARGTAAGDDHVVGE